MIEEIINQKYKHKYYIAKSSIHGKGLFSRTLVPKHHPIGIVVYYKWWFYPQITYMGSHINHSKSNYNSKLVYFNSKYYLVATRDIEPNEEILANYDGEDVPWFIDGSKPSYKD